MQIQYSLYVILNIDKIYFTCKKHFHQYLVGGVHDYRISAARLRRLIGDPYTFKDLGIRLFKGKMGSSAEKVYPVSGTFQPHGISHGKAYRDSHIRHSHLPYHRPVFEFYSRMKYALRVNKYLYILYIHSKQPLGLYDFKSLIHHGRRIYGYLLSHAPVWMFQGLLKRHFFELLRRSPSERSSGSRQKYLSDLSAFVALQTLEYSAVFAVHREYPDSSF